MSGAETHQGVVLFDIDLLNRGRYKVHIDTLHTHLSIADGIWCRNKTHPWKYNTDFVLGSYGSYYPLQAGTRVIVNFVDGNFEKGDIVAISADQEPFALPLYCLPDARDMITTIYRTPLYSNIFHINEITSVQPKNSIHSYFNCDIPDIVFCGKNDPDTAPETKFRTKYIINEDGVHFCTNDNIYVSVDQDGHIAVNGKVMIKIKKTVDLHIKGDNTKILIDGEVDVHIKKALKILVDKPIDIHCKARVNVKADGNISIQGGKLINLNCGTSAADAVDAEDTKGYNEKDPTAKELKGITRAGDIAAAVAKTAATLG